MSISDINGSFVDRQKRAKTKLQAQAEDKLLALKKLNTESDSNPGWTAARRGCYVTNCQSCIFYVLGAKSESYGDVLTNKTTVKTALELANFDNGSILYVKKQQWIDEQWAIIPPAQHPELKKNKVEEKDFI